ncbi:MAG: TonB-dependent receptor [Tannerella sp.]|jgi:TonB-linked SusC/RagA family outer membrane protein|nr:TonB-dependent receptor [Tannerella sp.]
MSNIKQILLRVMLCGVLLTFSGYATAIAQISLSVENKTMREVIKDIEKTSDYRFFYNDDLPGLAANVSVRIGEGSIVNVMNQLAAQADIAYLIRDNNQIVLSSVAAVPQQSGRRITGRVIDVNDEPVIGANIMEKGTSNGTVTDVSGNFSLTVAENAVLQVSFIGFTTQEISVLSTGGGIPLTIRLLEDMQALDEVVVIGYGTVRKIDMTGAVGSVKGDDIKSQGVSDITNSLQGRLPGVTIEAGSGTPGSGALVLIRGVGTFGNANPLYLVDGVPVDNMSNIPASDIESLNILKDASAAAIYGSRAANGVILVTTKSGAAGTPRISFDANAGFQNLAHKVDVLNAEEWANVSNAAHDAAGLPRLDIAQNPASLGEGTDWQDVVYRTGVMQQYQLGISGGTDVVKYSVTGGYNKHKGIVETSGYNRYNVRLKTEVTKGILKFGETFMAVNQRWGNLVTPGWGSKSDAVGASLVMIPVFDVYDPDAIGGFGGAYGSVVNIGNPLAQLKLRDNSRSGVNLINNTYAELAILPYLKYKFNVGYTRNIINTYDYTHRYTVGTLYTNPLNSLTEARIDNSTILLENTLTFDRKIGRHNIQALAGYTYQKYNYSYWTMSNRDIPDGIYVLDAARATPTAGGNRNEYILLSTLGRIIYSFDDKYLLTATFRRDGSSRFASVNQYGNFPSIALGWNLYREDFFNNAGLGDIFSNLKIRGSYGVLGNQEIGNYLYSASIANNLNYIIGTDQHRWVGGIQTNYATPDIRWETTRTFNAGLDISFFNNALSGTIDYFDKMTHDILLNVPIPISAGAGTNPTMNAGKMSNRGIEVGINYNGTAGKLSYNIYGTASHVRNKVIELGTGTQQMFGSAPTLFAAAATVAQAGGEVGEFYLRQMIGIFQSDEEARAYTKDGAMIQPYAKAGDIKFFDANNDGTINDLDRVNCGSPFPDIEYGLGFNLRMYGIDLAAYFHGVSGNKIYNGMKQELEGMNFEQNYSKSTLNAWTPQNTNTSVPRAVINDPNYNSYTSSRFLEDGAYLRLKTLQVGYTFDESLLRTVKVRSLRAFISADNLLTFTNYSGFNPDLGGLGRFGSTSNILNRGVEFSDNGSYPLARTVSFGIQLTL